MTERPLLEVEGVRTQFATYPGLAILLLVLSVNLFGEGLRDALDPRMSL